MTDNTPPDGLMSLSELSEATGISVNTLRVARQRGAFPAVKRHGLWLARIEDVQAYNERAATKGANPRIADLERENAELAARVAELERRFAGDDATA